MVPNPNGEGLIEVGLLFKNNPGARAYTVGNITYWNSKNIVNTDKQKFGQSQIQGAEFHEGLHGLGLSDNYIQRTFWGPDAEDPLNTNRITRKLAEDCFALP